MIWQEQIFFRTHRAYLVHFKYVEKYDATCVTMKNGTALIAKKELSFVRRYLSPEKEISF